MLWKDIIESSIEIILKLIIVIIMLLGEFIFLQESLDLSKDFLFFEEYRKDWFA